MAAVVVPVLLLGALLGHPFLDFESRVDLGRSGACGSPGDGGGLGWHDFMASAAGVPQQPPQVIIDRRQTFESSSCGAIT